MKELLLVRLINLKILHCATFIEFARNDLSTSQNLHAIYNAVSNDKRALHRRVDILCSLAGYETYIAKKK